MKMNHLCLGPFRQVPLLAVALLVATAACVSDDTSDVVAVSNVSVVDVETGQIREGQIVVVADTVIQSIGPVAEVEPPRGARQINGDGMYLMPGLWDAHTHLSKARSVALPVLIAHGITTVMDMGGDHDELQTWQLEIAQGVRVGPTILMAGSYLESATNVTRMLSDSTVEPVTRARVPVATTEEAHRAVARLAERGVDYVKIRTAESPEVYRAVADAAAMHGLKLFGHAMDSSSPDDLLATGQDGVAHLYWPGLAFLPDKERRRAVERLAESNTSFTPTLVTLFSSLLRPREEFQALLDDPPEDPLHPRNLLSAYLVADWMEQAGEATGLPPGEQLDELISLHLRVFRELHAAGAPFFAGTDLAVLGIYPGVALHDELALLVRELGLSPLDALRAATIAPATYLGLQDRTGSIARGKQADLLLLSANPLDQVDNTRQIHGVFVRGRYFDRAALDQLAVDVAGSALLTTNDWR